MKPFAKMLLSVLLILIIAHPAFAAIEPSEKRYTNLRTYSLVEETTDLSSYPVYAPAHALTSFGFEETDEEGLIHIGSYEDIFGDQPLTLKYASDDFSTLMFGISDHIVCLRNDRLIVTAPSYSRGVEDTYKAFQYIAGWNAFQTASTRSGMTFSSDGKYALFIDGYTALSHFNSHLQLIILDVEAGEWYLGYTWPVNFLEDGECILGACFDESNEYIYIKAYGSAYGNVHSFLRYRMETGEMEHLNSNNLWSYWQNVFRAPDGTYVYEIIPNILYQPCGLVVYKEIEGKWFACPEYFPARRENLHIGKFEMKGENGQALLLSEMKTQLRDSENGNGYSSAYLSDPVYIMSLPVINGGVHGLKEFIQFNDDLTQAKRKSISEFIAESKEKAPGAHDSYKIINAALSPDGKYAFVIFSGKGDYEVRIINTQTLIVFKVSFEDGAIGDKIALKEYADTEYPVAIQYIANDLIIINTESGIRLFRIQ